MTNEQFDAWANGLGLEFFRPHELRFLGGQHYQGKARGLNTLPPKALLRNMERLARALDQIRREFGQPIRILSGYRSYAYNRAIGGATYSRHMEFDALDIAPMRGTVARLHATCVAARKRGLFVGGIGRYSGFVHIDDRGTNTNWKG
jgi:uncharacterized protein YcbK (DUF882 family)